MSDTDTPETSAYGGVCRETHRIDGLTLYEQSKKLERERDQAVAELAELRRNYLLYHPGTATWGLFGKSINPKD